ncbi:hypothetical protein LCGC14_2001620 [marine sediment metagenome]|uniref:Methyltransferase type 11 domain-containing protein n=1 Tax=marine sediment metagenome TaxID=412755 RepID=A0A0F9FQS8_9ZZZZ
MEELKITGESILCVGARHSSEVEFFEKKGFKAEGIDLFEANKIIKCDMSKMLKHPYIKDQKYDIVFCNEVMEHCVDLDGFIKGLNKICKKYFVCLGPASKEKKEIIRYNWWDCSVHKFMININNTEVYSKNLLTTFKEFKIVINESYKEGHRLFFILEKKL